MADPPFDVSAAHRQFAVQLNNLAWDLVDAGDRSADDVEQMIHAAHAACFHWSRVGTPINDQRALCLLVTAYLSAGRPEQAMHYARQCLSLSERLEGEQSDFDRATAIGCAAKAFAAMGSLAESETLSRQAWEIAARFEDPADREVYRRYYS